ncbi:MAG: acyl-CoA dehydrogenase [Spirochaetes bacterium RBG_13_51_14]|nr:MAG: acyl-CoA dehydrogenase [Spirochaetes bacterium RBG_13_51_14]
MAERFVSKKNISFLLYDVFDVESLTRYPYFSDHGRETFDMVIDTALKIATDQMHPVFMEMDRQEPQYNNGTVSVHPAVKKYIRTAGEGGWISATKPYDVGGQQLPNMINFAAAFIFGAANYSLSIFPGLTAGAANLIDNFGSPDLKDAYLRMLYSGKWQGTMALTEPGAGSSLSDITTQAAPTPDGYYLISGQKIFISCGRHDAVENVIHLMLARIKGAPAGVKGISLFVVPTFRPEGGELVFNDVTCAGIDHKLGYKGSPIAQLSMGESGDCRGWLVGEPHRGLAYMFQMMNEERIGVGIGAASIASAAYYASLEYALTRTQGRRVSEKNPAAPPVPIIEHADVKRMLLFQRAVTEGALALLLQVSRYLDCEKVSAGEDKEKYHLLVELLTPVVKTYPSEMGILSVSQGLQILGGYGYCKDFPLEQHYRDMRIHPIHEGTTGIQGMDILGRKVRMNDGKAMALFIDEVNADIAAARGHDPLKGLAAELEQALRSLTDVTSSLFQTAMKAGVEVFLADATLYLELFGLVCVAWQWLKQGTAASAALAKGTKGPDGNFHKGKIASCRFFFAYELPKSMALIQRLMNTDGLTVEVTADLFED